MGLGICTSPRLLRCYPILPSEKVKDNKLVYIILEDATQVLPLASSYLRQAPVQHALRHTTHSMMVLFSQFRRHRLFFWMNWQISDLSQMRRIQSLSWDWKNYSKTWKCYQMELPWKTRTNIDNCSIINRIRRLSVSVAVHGSGMALPTPQGVRGS